MASINYSLGAKVVASTLLSIILLYLIIRTVMFYNIKTDNYEIEKMAATEIPVTTMESFVVNPYHEDPELDSLIPLVRTKRIRRSPLIDMLFSTYLNGVKDFPIVENDTDTENSTYIEVIKMKPVAESQRESENQTAANTYLDFNDFWSRMAMLTIEKNESFVDFQNFIKQRNYTMPQNMLNETKEFETLVINGTQPKTYLFSLNNTSCINRN